MGYAFISYSTKNKDFADGIKSLLNKNGIETWMAPNDIPVGSKYAEVIGKAIKNCSCLILLLTNNSQNSTWVAKEVERAVNYKKVIIPVQLEDLVLNDEFEMYISTDQILPIKKIDDSSVEIKNLLSILKKHTESKNDEPVSVNEMMDGATQQIQVGTVIDEKYRIVSALGQGGCCQVFLAVNEKTKQSLAIKVIPKSSEQYSAFIQNLSTEISLLNHLNHPGIPAVIDIIDTKTYLLVVMDYIDGASLSQVISESGAQSEELVLDWAIQLSEILGYLHSQKPAIIHNDLQPSNIMLKSNGRIMLVDFDMSQKIESNMQDTLCIGKAYYTAPEKYGSGKIDQRTDIYSVGVTLYSIITGNDPSKPPYMIYPIRKVNPALSKGFEYIIAKCMEPNPEDRYQNTDELLFDLHNIDKMTYKLDHPSFFKRLLNGLKKK